jgi:DNA (cytosine-5)-methyltransferase 1
VSRPTVVDLFCGCGGLSAGFRRAGFAVRLGVERDPVPLATFARNFPEAVALRADLAVTSPADVLAAARLRRGRLDCLVGGPPCQGWSKNVPARERSADDPRNALMRRFVEFVAELRPRAVLIENVAEVAKAYDAATTDHLLGRFAALGYDATAVRVNAADFGVPQLRRRNLFLAVERGAPLPVPRPVGAPPVTVDEAIADLPPLEAGAGTSPCGYASQPTSAYQKLLRRDDGTVTEHVARALRPRQLARVRAIAPGSGGGADALPESLRPRMTYSGGYARLYPDQPARTITRWVFHPGSGRFFHPWQDRVVTIREAARLQGFPDEFVFTGRYIQNAHMVGEAVPPLLAAAVADAVLASLGSGRRRS